MALAISTFLGKQVAEAIGLPTERLVSFELKFAVDELVTATCVFLAEDRDGQLVNVIKNFEVVERK